MRLFKGPIAGPLSPLRYPGGKGALAPILARIIERQETRCTTYVEPFAGGAGAALRLMYDEYVDDIVLNDLDRGIANMWRSIFFQTDDFVELVMSRPITLNEWHRQRGVLKDVGRSDLEIGFATFFLNRTNRSGILNARPIGGLQQSGKWKIDARFNRADLAARIQMLGRYRNRVTVLQEDGVDVARTFLSGRDRNFVYVDPPYIEKGSDLYMDTLSWEDHVKLSKVLQGRRGQWVLTYDHDARVPRDLYPGRRFVAFDIAHTAQIQHVGREYAVFSDQLELEDPAAFFS